MKRFCVQTNNGDFLATNGDFTSYVSEALLFNTKEAATRCSFRFIASRVIELGEVFGGYEETSLLEHENFINHIAGAK